MAYTSRSIVTVAEMGQYLNETFVGTAKQATIELFIDLCSGMIEEETERKYGTQDSTFYLDGNDASILPLPFPIVSLYGDDDTAKLASVQYREDSDSAWTDLVDDIDLIHIDTLYPMQIELLDDETFPSGRKNIRIRMYVGYDSVPALVRKYCLEMVACMWKESGNGDGRIGLESQSMSTAGSGGSTSFRDMWNEAWRPGLKTLKVDKPNVFVVNL